MIVKQVALSPMVSGPTDCGRSQMLGVSCVEPSHFESVASMSDALFGMTNHGKAYGVVQIDANDKRIAVVEIRGTLTKHGFVGRPDSSLAILADVVRSLARDETINAIVLVVDSPGGTVAGTADLANAIHSAKQIKPVVAYVEDLAASAAYWVASQATAIYANNQTALVGSIGVFQAFLDMSRFFEARGIETVVIRSSEHKGVGVAGDKITESQRASIQGRVNATAREFKNAILRGREAASGRYIIDKLSTGEVFSASFASDVGLIDGIANFEQLVYSIAKGLK